MSCLGQCGDCQCEKIDVCVEVEQRQDVMEKKLKVLKDYACLLANTSCVGLPKRLAQYAYFLWCFLRDLLIMVVNLDKRVDNLCAVANCHEKKLNALVDFLIGKLSDNVELAMKSSTTVKDTAGGQTYTVVKTDSNGNFTIVWNMVDTKEVGVGNVYGKVIHSYTPNKDGSIHAKITGITISRIKYVNKTTTTEHNGRFTIYDANDKVIYQKAYDPGQSFEQEINQTLDYNKEFDLKPDGGSSDAFKMLSTLDEWVYAPTRSAITAQYINNNPNIGLPTDPCNVLCGACDWSDEKIAERKQKEEEEEKKKKEEDTKPKEDGK